MHQRLVVAGLLAGLVWPACAGPEADAPAAVAPVEPAAAAIDLVPVSLPEVVAHVNGMAIARHEFERAVQSAEVQAGQVVPPQFRDEVYRRVLDRLIDFHLLLQESRARDLAVDESAVEAEIARVVAGFDSEAAFEAQLDEWQSTFDEVREEARKDLLIAKVIDIEVAPQLGLDEEAVRAFYERHPGQFAEDDAVRARHILIETTPDADPAARDAARTRADTVRHHVLAGETDFEELAREYSGDVATAESGGDLGFVKRGQTVEPFEAALFALEPGGVSDVVESPFGFHIITAVERREGRVIPFDEASGQIRLLLLDQARRALTVEFITRLRQAGAIEIHI